MLTKEDDYRVSLQESIIEDLERLSMPELTRVYKFIRTHVIANIPGLQPPDNAESQKPAHNTGMVAIDELATRFVRDNMTGSCIQVMECFVAWVRQQRHI